MKKCVLMFSLLIVTIVIASITEKKNKVLKEETAFKTTNNSLDSLLANTNK
ncbi:hypothetical protein [Cellulophaga fucicola]|nr:hypothetical protein [Cellulophaga fucicola]